MAILGPEIKYVFFFCKILIAANQNVFFFLNVMRMNYIYYV